MKIAQTTLLAVCILASGLVYGQKKSTKKDEKVKEGIVLENNRDTISYLIGIDIGSNFVNNGLDIDPEKMAAGMKDAMGGKDDMIDKDLAMELIQNYQMELNRKQQEKQESQMKESRKKGDTFLAENKTKPGVVVLESGLQYKVIKEAEGRKPLASDRVKVHYHGTLIDGNVFDSSVDRGEPIVFPLNGVIAGWTEGVQLMSVGSKYKFFIPPSLGYGDRPVGPIPASSVLIFEVELLEIED